MCAITEEEKTLRAATEELHVAAVHIRSSGIHKREHSEHYRDGRS